MKRFLVFVCACVFASSASAQVALHQLSENAELIAKVQSMPASMLDKKLPSVRLADWLQAVGVRVRESPGRSIRLPKLLNRVRFPIA